MFRSLSFRRSMKIAAIVPALVVALGWGAEAAISHHRARIGHRTATFQGPALKSEDRVALVIGNSLYPDAERLLPASVANASVIAKSLERAGFHAVLLKNAKRQDVLAAADSIGAAIKPGAAVAIYFDGLAIQSDGRNFLIPTDAEIWTEAGVKRAGVDLEALMNQLRADGAGAELVMLNGARRNPFERRFRIYSHGLAPINGPVNSISIVSTAPGTLLGDTSGSRDAFVSALTAELASNTDVDDAFFRARSKVVSASQRHQVPNVSSMLIDPVKVGPNSAVLARTLSRQNS
jgi:uncharacterized caspase-like protein